MGYRLPDAIDSCFQRQAGTFLARVKAIVNWFVRRLSIVGMAVALMAPHRVPGADADAPAWRDPFWPVGFAPEPVKPKADVKPIPPPRAPVVKPAAEPPKPVVDWKEARRGLKVMGFAEADGIRRCFVGGRLVSEGETVSLTLNGLRYAWRVTRIAPDPARNLFEEAGVRPVADGQSDFKR